jgi:hypothetical protein
VRRKNSYRRDAAGSKLSRRLQTAAKLEKWLRSGDTGH